LILGEIDHEKASFIYSYRIGDGTFSLWMRRVTQAF
jgi:hypothetical protein